MKLNIKQLVDKKCSNKHQFAHQMQIGYASACNLYEGKTERIYFDTLEKMCKILNCTPNDILVPEDDVIMQLYSKSNS